MTILPSVPLTYVIGTVGLLAILGIVTLISTNTGLSLQGDLTKSSLADAAHYVSREMTVLVSVSSSVSNGTLAYNLAFPHQINQRGFAINLTKSDGLWYVVAYVPNNPSLQAREALAFQTSGNPSLNGICVYSAPTNPDFCPLPSSSALKVVNPLPVLYSGDSKAAVWAVVNKGQIILGIGDITP